MKCFCKVLLALWVAVAMSACGGGGGGSSNGGGVTASSPSITSGPSAANVNAGQTATFTVVASGSGTLTYQWKRNGVDIPGATASSYTTPTVTQADSGAAYSVTVSNSLGSASSGAVALSVAPAGSGFADSPAAATALAAEANSAIAAAENKALVPGAIDLSGGLPTGVVTTINCTVSGTVVYDFPSSITAGTSYSYMYNNCSYSPGYVFNGGYTVRYSSFSSNPVAFAWTATYNLQYTGPNNFNYSYSGSQSCNYNNSAYSCTYSDGSRTFQSNFTYTNGVINGSYVWAYGSYGNATFTFTNWSATSGTATITGPNGFTATIVRTSANTFVVTINGGTPRTVTI